MNINRNNYEEYFISYMENELNDAERSAVEQFTSENTDLKNELKLFQQTKLVADEKIIFADKESLIQKNSTKIIAWKWNINVWASAAILLLLLGVGWWMMNQSAVSSKQFSVKKENEKVDSTINSKSKSQNQKLKHDAELRIRNSEFVNTESHSSSKINIVRMKTTSKQNFITKTILPETIDTADLPDSWKNRKFWNQTHEISVVQEIKHEEFTTQPQKIVHHIDTIKAFAQNSIFIQPMKKQEEKIIAQIPLKTNKNKRQILKMLAWASGKILGDKQNDSNFDVAIGFVEVSHKQALTNN